MTLLYIEGKVGDFTVYLERPIEKPWFITLRSCTFYNNFINLPSDGLIYYGGENFVVIIPPGHYTPDTLKHAVNNAKVSGSNPVSIETVSGKLTIKALQNVVLGEKLADLLGVKERSLKAETSHEIHFKKPLDCVYIYCDLIDPSQVIAQTIPSQILACVEISKKNQSIGEKIFYKPCNPVRVGVKSGDFVSSICFKVRDSLGNTINLPTRLVLEIV